MDKDNSWSSRENRTESSSKSPPVNFINITRRPQGGIMNIEMTRTPGNRQGNESTSGNIGGDSFFRTQKMPSLGTLNAFDDPFFKNESFDINSLMRKHQETFENFGFGNRARSTDSNQSELVINPPPRPIQVERQTSGEAGSPYRVIIHPRSHSSDNVVVESSSDNPGGTITTTRHIISPKSGSTGNVSVLETKFPSLRFPFGQRSFQIQSPLFGDGSSRPSLFDRFNEHAPPSFFRSNNDNIHVSKVTVMRDGPQRSRVHNIPIKIEGRDSSSHPKPSVVYKIPINLVNRNSESKNSQPPLPVQVSLKPKGVSIPIITHRSRPSEAEEKLAQLTKQLEEEMKMTGATKQQQQMRQQVHQQEDLNKKQEIQKQNQLLQQQQQQSQLKKQQNASQVATLKQPPQQDTTIPQLTDFSSYNKNTSILNKNIEPFKETSKEIYQIEPNKEKDNKIGGVLIKGKVDTIKNEKAKENKIVKDIYEKEVKDEDKEEDYPYGDCYSCEKEVRTDACLILGRLYHCRCFVCSVCGRTMKGSMYYDVNGVVFCEQDYMKSGYNQVADVCTLCNQIIRDYLVRGAGGKYHRDCFKCCHCSLCLESQPFTFDAKSNLYCLDHYYEHTSPKCYSCHKCIKPAQDKEDVKKVLIEDKALHEECYKCQDCRKQLGFTIETGAYPFNDTLLLCSGCSSARQRS